MSMALSNTSLVVSLAACTGAVMFAVKVRALRIQAEKDAARATRISPEQRIKQHLEDSGGCAKLVSVGEHGCDTTLPKRQGDRPTHPDGTPYRYHEIAAEGWGHCDGCRQWGQWTTENPHECAQPSKVSTDVTVHVWEDPAAIGAEIARALRQARRDDI